MEIAYQISPRLLVAPMVVRVCDVQPRRIRTRSVYLAGLALVDQFEHAEIMRSCPRPASQAGDGTLPSGTVRLYVQSSVRGTLKTQPSDTVVFFPRLASSMFSMSLKIMHVSGVNVFVKISQRRNKMPSLILVKRPHARRPGNHLETILESVHT